MFISDVIISFEKVFDWSSKELYRNRTGTIKIFDVNKEGKEATNTVYYYFLSEKNIRNTKKISTDTDDRADKFSIFKKQKITSSSENFPGHCKQLCLYLK